MEAIKQKSLKTLGKQKRFSREDVLRIVNHIEQNCSAYATLDTVEGMGFHRYEGERVR